MAKHRVAPRGRLLRGFQCGAILALALAMGASVLGKLFAAQTSTKAEPAIPVRYTDVRESSKITFQQDSTQTDEKYYLETMGTGVGWIDYDQDGLMDLFFVQSGATDVYKPPHPLRGALYHNNGYPDLYVTGYGRAILYHNNGDGTFTEVTAKAGVVDEGGWSTSAGWFDYDKDGWLDLVV